MRKIFLLFLLGFAGVAQAQFIPNSGLESWEIQGQDTVPTGWAITSFGAGKSPIASTGEGALTLWNWYCYGEGIATTKFPVTASAGVYQLTGSYKYILGQNGGSGTGTDDSAVVAIVFLKFNTLKKWSDTVGLAVGKLGPSDDFITFAIPFSVIDMADSVELTFISSEAGFCTSVECECLYFTFDNLAFMKLDGNVHAGFKSTDIPASPNPFNKETLLGTAPDGGCKVIVTSLQGIDVIEREYRGGEQMILRDSDLDEGTYHYRLISKIDIRTGKVIKH